MGTLLASLPLAAFLEWWQWLLIVVIIGLIVGVSYLVVQAVQDPDLMISFIGAAPPPRDTARVSLVVAPCRRPRWPSAYATVFPKGSTKR